MSQFACHSPRPTPRSAVLASDGFETSGQKYRIGFNILARSGDEFGDAETGLANGAGWRLQAFIEDRDGALRPQSIGETVFCVGCHGGIGVTDDSTFAFARKIDAPAGGWFHWSRQGLIGIADPTGADGAGEYARYLAENGAGDEFRSNDEIIGTFFDPDGKPKAEALARLRDDVGALLYLSRRRGLNLDKAYRTIVIDQDFIRGRDPMLSPATNVHREVAQDQPTGIEDPVSRR